MFDIGFWELALIFVVMLVVLGPERLPGLARTAGVWIGKARRLVSEVRAEVERELQVEEIKRSISQQVDTEEFKRLADQVRSINSDVQSSLDTDRAVAKAAQKTPSDSPPSSNPPAQ